MRRLRDRRPEPLFRSGELLRMMALLGLLAILCLMFFRAREASVWKYLANAGENENEVEEGVARPANHSVAAVAERGKSPAAKPPATAPEAKEKSSEPPPIDEDPEELDAIREEFQAVSDRTPLTGVEMPAYWRLIRWAREEPLASLEKRAKRGVLFTHLAESPDKYRGKLIRLRLHLARSLSHEPDEDPLQVGRIYEAWGATDELRGIPYLVVFTERPPGMPISSKTDAEITFYGYFLKLMAYESVDEKHRMTPMLIGRVVWHPPVARAFDEPAWVWAAILGAAIALLVAVGVATKIYLTPRPLRTAAMEEHASRAVASWLENAQSGVGPEAEPANGAPIYGQGLDDDEELHG